MIKSQPDRSVVLWIGKHQVSNLFITTLTQAKILYGLEILPEGKRPSALQKAARSMFELDFANRILPFDSNVAQLFATISAKRRKIGRPISQIDAQITAITRFNKATLATRNVKDFAECDINIVNPWR